MRVVCDLEVYIPSNRLIDRERYPFIELSRLNDLGYIQTGFTQQIVVSRFFRPHGDFCCPKLPSDRFVYRESHFIVPNRMLATLHIDLGLLLDSV